MRLLDMFRIPPRVILKKGVQKIGNEFKFLFQRMADRFRSTYLADAPASLNHPHQLRPANLLSSCELPYPALQSRDLFGLTEYYIRHYFDLLGSGWIQVKHGMECRGLEGFIYRTGNPIQSDPEGRWLQTRVNQANCSESRRIWRFIDRDYTPIDWQLDFKSGYRWSENTYYLDIRYGHKPGADIKAPWELSRMQHLPQLAITFALSAGLKPETTSSDIYIREFRNQVLDFIATNPPRFGVNWRCTMDVAIRVSNWLVAHDIFSAAGVKFDSEFEHIFIRSIYEHGRHIIKNLEWNAELRTNHYLADIVGLLLVSAYLPVTPETSSWLRFAVKELIAEVKLQFHEDGGNFEASTCYHRLAAEMVVYATALVLGLPGTRWRFLSEDDGLTTGTKLKQAPVQLYPLPGSDRFTPFPRWFYERLEKMAEFTMHITKPNGHVPQIGDNDSGRFLKLQPVLLRMKVAEAKNLYGNLQEYSAIPDAEFYWCEDILDHRHLVAAINGLFDRRDFFKFAGDAGWETGLIRRFSKQTIIPSYVTQNEMIAVERVLIGSDSDWRQLITGWNLRAEDHSKRVFTLPEGNLLAGFRTYAYPDFGLYLFCSNRLYLAVRCGSIGQNGNGGHAHNDQLSIELNIDGQDWIVDPGSYLYTPLPAKRNLYRSVRSHYAPSLGNREPGKLDQGLFTIVDSADGRCIWFGGKGFIGKYQAIELLVLVNNDSIVLKAGSPLGRVVWNYHPVPFSDGYGRVRS